MPAVQKPHCRPCCSPARASPSIVVIEAPSACAASIVQDFTDSPSTSTVHAPQLDVSQPTFVPVSPHASRRYWTSRVRGSTSWSRPEPLTVIATRMGASCQRSVVGGTECSPREPQTGGGNTSGSVSVRGCGPAKDGSPGTSVSRFWRRARFSACFSSRARSFWVLRKVVRRFFAIRFLQVGRVAGRAKVSGRRTTRVQNPGRPPYREFSDCADVLRLFALTTGGNVKLDALTLFERAVAVALDRGEVDEHVVPALARDEAETLVGVEPLDGAGCHDVLLVSVAVFPCRSWRGLGRGTRGTARKS